MFVFRDHDWNTSTVALAHVPSFSHGIESNSLGQLPPVKTPPNLRFIAWMHTNMHAPVACMCLSWRLISYLRCICTCLVRVSKDQTLYNSVKQYHTSFYAIANPEYLSFNEPDIFEKDCKAPPTMLSVKSETPPREDHVKPPKVA